MKADQTQVIDWLERMHAGSPGLLHVCGTGDWTGRRFGGNVQTGANAYRPMTAFERAAEAARYVMDRDAAGQQGIYLRTTTLMPSAPVDHGKRAGATFSCALPGLWADIDIAGPGHKLVPNVPDLPGYNPSKPMQYPLPAGEEAARAIVDEAGLLKPTLWVHSGGGLYPWWLLDLPLVIDGDVTTLEAATALSEGWQRLLEAGAQRLGVDYGNVGDLARVMRIPGTINRKEGLERPCRVIQEDGPTYSFDELVECQRAAANTLAAVEARRPAPALAPVPAPIAAGPGPIPAALAAPRPGSPLDAFELNTPWANILEPAGWTMHHEGGGTTYWTRPGKRRGEGHSATTGRSTDGRDRMWVFSTACGLPVNEPMTKPYVWGVLNGHGSDMKSIAKALVTTGYGVPLSAAPVAFTTPLRSSQPFATPPAPAPVANVTPPPWGSQAPVAPMIATIPGPAEWHPAPARPGDGPNLPPFPVMALPPAMRDLVMQVAATRQVDPIMPALFALSAISAVSAGRLQVRRSGNWLEALSFYTLPVAESGERKSPTGRDVFGAITRIERQMAAEHNDAVDVIIDELDAQRAAVGSNPAAANRLEDKITEAQASRKKPPRIRLADDITPEALVKTLAFIGGHGAILDAEGTFMGILTGRYTKGNPNPELIIKAYDGDTYTADRISRDSDRIERPTLAMALAVQRVVLEDAMSNKALIERGALARIVYGFPASKVGSRWQRDAAPYDSGPERVWSLVLEGIMEIPKPEHPDQTPCLALSPQALARHMDLTDQIESRLGPGGDLAASGIAQWGHKHAGRILRIAALLHLAAGFTATSEIQADTLEAAIAIGEWSVEHARHAHRIDRESVEEATVRQCTATLDWIARSGAAHLTVREVCRGVRSQWVNTKSMTDALDQLAGLGWVREEQYQDKAGRWRGRFAVSPHISRATIAATM